MFAVSAEPHILVVHAQVDVLLLPSAPGVPPTVAEASEWGNEQMLSIDAINVTGSLAGVPASFHSSLS